MGQQDVSDEVMLQRAGASAERLLEHLSQSAAGKQARGTGSDATMTAPAGELESAIISLRSLIVVLHKESQRT